MVGPLIVTSLTLRDFRSYASLSLELVPGLTLVVGPNGAGKTNLLDAVHVGTQGFSFRTRRDSVAVRTSAHAARVAVGGTTGSGRAFRTEVTLTRGEGKRILLDGSSVGSIDTLRTQLPVLAFTPDRLAVVKGPPAIRRTYLDRALGRIEPSTGRLPGEYATALSQRNAALRRAAVGRTGVESVSPWTATTARLGAELDAARARATARLSPVFAAMAARLGLAAAEVDYRGSGISEERLADRLSADLDRGTTGIGPHLEDVPIRAGGRDLRVVGSQGEQRTAVLALLLAEAEVIEKTRGDPPVLLLDDVLSELDQDHRRALLEVLPARQAVVTATGLRALPEGSPPVDLVVEVTPGAARPR